MSLQRPTLLSRSGNRSGFTLVEILVVIAIIALLAGVALPAITGAIKKARESSALQAAHGLATAEFQYATDNNGVFPGKIGAVTAGTSSEIFQDALVPSYISNTDTLWIAGGPGAKYTGATAPYALGTGYGKSVSWDLVLHSDSTGLIATDPDTSPVIMSTGSTVASWGTAGTSAPITATITSMDYANNPFGYDGVAVGYKDMSSAFESATSAGGTASGGFNITSSSYTPVILCTKVHP